ncbi:MAG: hypothetical protein HFJ45_04450 [Clostridia bacterium]|nr:hypothetical protein [Clostridia bacterium]
MGIVKKSIRQDNYKNIQLICNYEVQDITLVYYSYYNHVGRKRLNYFVEKVYYGMAEDELLIYSPIVYYTNQCNKNVCVMDNKIITLFHGTFPVNLFVTQCGVIMIWQLHNLLISIDMCSFKLPKHLKEFILKYDICGLYDKEGHDYLTVLNHKTGQMEKFEIICTIDLTKKDLVNIELFPVFN